MTFKSKLKPTRLKPRLVRVKRRNIFMGHGETWRCFSVFTPFAGYGGTPLSAYNDWQCTNRYYIIDYERDGDISIMAPFRRVR